MADPLPAPAGGTLRRERIVAERLRALLARHVGADPARTGAPDEPLAVDSRLTRRRACALFEAALQSRAQDLLAREMRNDGLTFYTIGSIGHEANAVFGALLRTTDPAFLHYRSGAFLAARQRKARGETPLFDAMLAFCASAQDPVSGGRHKVLGSHALFVPPQTSTIASHLPKAAGYAFSLARMQRLGVPARVPYDSVVYCSFGDASANHATAQAGFNAAAAAHLQQQPCPILFVCEDNGIGISVRTPSDFIAKSFAGRNGLAYFEADGRDWPRTWARAEAAVELCRRARRPVFFHLRTVRMLGHAGTDQEGTYLTPAEVAANEDKDPLLTLADLLISSGALSREAALALLDDTEERVRRAGAEAARRPKLASAAEVRAPLELPDPDSLAVRVAARERRIEKFGRTLPEDDRRPRHMALRISQALKDLLAAYPELFVFGEDVAKKGGVYNVTAGLYDSFRAGRVFNTILDETTILGLAQGMAQAGCIALPEIQYLAYVHNALDQIRGEAASFKFFSGGRCTNPMVVRVAGLAYQKGFGGHFHNDDSVGALLDIPGLVLAVPSRADDAVRMLRTCVAAAETAGTVSIFLEPIALYMTKDLHEQGDGAWLFDYPPPHELARLGEPRVYEAAEGDELTLATYGNGLWMSLRARRRLQAEGLRVRVVDLRWLAPLPYDELARHARETGRLLFVDECRRTAGGPSALVLADLCQRPELERVRLRRIAAEDSYVPLGPAADTVLVQEADIVRAALELAGERVH